MERSFEGSWGRGADKKMEEDSERIGDFEGRLNFVQNYVNDVMRDEKLVQSLIGQGVQEIGEDEEKAQKFAKRNPHLVPEDVTEMGDEYKGAFIIVLSNQLKAQIQ